MWQGGRAWLRLVELRCVHVDPMGRHVPDKRDKVWLVPLGPYPGTQQERVVPLGLIWVSQYRFGEGVGDSVGSFLHFGGPGGSIWAPLGPIREPLGHAGGHLDIMWVPLGYIWAPMVAIWARLGAIFIFLSTWRRGPGRL